MDERTRRIQNAVSLFPLKSLQFGDLGLRHHNTRHTTKDPHCCYHWDMKLNHKLNVIFDSEIMYGFSAIFLVLALASAVLAELQDHWSQQDNNRISSLAKSIIRAKDCTAKDSYFSLQLLQELSSVDGTCTCDALSSSSLIDAYYGILKANVCNCNVQSDAQLLSTIKLGLKSDDVETIVSAIGLAKYFKKYDEELVAALSKLRSLIFVDGEWNLPLSDVSGTLSKLHLILELLVTLKDDSDAKPLASDLFEKLLQMLPGGDGDILSDPTLVYLLSTLSGKKIKIEKSALKLVAEQLIHLKFSEDPASLFGAYKSLDIIRTYKTAPYHARLTAHTFSPENDMALEVEVFDVLGKKMTVDEMEIISLKAFGKDSFATQNMKENGSKASIPSQDLSPGRYNVNVAATLGEKQTTTKFQSVVVVSETVNIGSVSIGISDSKQLPADLTFVSNQNSLSGLSASAVAQEVVHVTFKVYGANKESTKRPHQAFVRFTHAQSSVSHVFPASKVSDGSGYEFHATITVGDETETFDYQSGDYLVSILVADAIIIKPIEWVIGSVELKFPNRPVVNLPLYAKSLLHTSDTTLQALPEIEHQMRPPAKRASNFMAGSFTLLTVFPLLAFIGFNLSLKPNFAKLTSLSSVIFVVLIGAILSLYYGYWLSLDGFSFYETIKYLCIFFPITIMVGKYSLNSIATARLEKEKKH